MPIDDKDCKIELTMKICKKELLLHCNKLSTTFTFEIVGKTQDSNSYF